ncbi:hypothetical protein BU23DRAFT_307076 [Bimuria novae-zelandiae CBS 107.79]|uniref:Uncharacterized protein n=1 Tax=Bimuria novae-zelandiae CBS 107.79 TaxID=1447943 RepID=A0A6A5UPR9_9PLEO|nr:hypothetical protein BU23DRAFT_307076 [Bimuria novae-zelandiae CBS 107.79]
MAPTLEPWKPSVKGQTTRYPGDHPNQKQSFYPSQPPQAAMAELAREIQTIIDASYLVSLRNLAQICKRVDAITVRACIRQLPPCAVAKLASSLLESLPLLECCVGIVQCLAQSVEFKTELLSHQVGLLDAVLTKANTSQRDFDQYHGLCVELLSHPLPEGVPLPASVQPFFLRLFEQAYCEPDVRTLRTIYHMLKGACRGLHALLPADVCALLDEQLYEILKKKIAGDTMLVLWCFGVATLSEHPEILDIRGDHNKDLAASAIHNVKWTTASGRKMFESSSACEKTITLTCLSVIWAIKGGTGVSDDEALEGIKIATRTLQFIDDKTRENWVTTNANARSFIPKLLEKLQRSDLNSSLLREALYFFAVIGDPNKLPQSVVASYEATLLDISCCNDIKFQGSFSNSLHLFANSLQQGPLQSVLGRILDTNISPKSIDELQNTTMLVDVIAMTATKHESFRSHLLTALSNRKIQDSVEAFLGVCPGDLKGHQNTSCRNHDTMIHQTCLSATISMLLTILLVAGPARATHMLPSLGIALLEKQRQLLVPTHQCARMSGSTVSGKKSSNTISLFEQECTPISGLPLQDWRGRLKSEMDSHAAYQRESIIRAVTQICHDLEVRCETVEEPLRCERDKSRALEEELSRSRACVDNLEQKRLDDHLFYLNLESEKTHLEQEYEKVCIRLETLQTETAKSNSQAETALQEAREVREAFEHKETQLVRNEPARNGLFSQMAMGLLVLGQYTAQRLISLKDIIRFVLGFH